MAQLQQMDPERRRVVMAQIMQKQQQMVSCSNLIVNEGFQQFTSSYPTLQQQQQQQQPGFPASGGVPFNPSLHTAQNHANMNAVLNMMNSQNQVAAMMGMNSSSSVPHMGMNNTGGVQGGMNYEMLRSMMQRGADGSVNMNQQP